MNLIAMQGFGDKAPLSIHRRLLMRSSYVKYGMEGLMTSIYGYDRELLPCPNDYCHYRIPKEILQITRKYLTSLKYKKIKFYVIYIFFFFFRNGKFFFV